MRAVNRGTDPPPPGLDARDRNNLTELERARAHQSNPAPNKGSFKFSAYKDGEVKRRLEQLFHGKCAYCETYYSASAPVDIEHYRPKGAVSEDPAHPGYWWLAMSWDNLLPSCIDCNRKRKQVVVQPGTSLAELQRLSRTSDGRVKGSGKKDSFPIATGGIRAVPEMTVFAAEAALLLDPCRDDPEEHLAFHVAEDDPIGVIVPKGDPQQSERGATSIHVYGLNRLGLVQERTRVLRHLEFLADLAVELGSMADDIHPREPKIAGRLRFLQDRTLAEMAAMADPEAPYSAAAKAWLRAFKRKLEP